MNENIYNVSGMCDASMNPMNLGLVAGSWYWITYGYFDGQIKRNDLRTLLRQCKQVRSDGYGLFGEVYANGWGGWQDTVIWINTSNCVLANPQPVSRKGFWANLFS